MPTNILMPALSPTMEEGKLAKWLKERWETPVKSGDILAEIETDKATMEVEAIDEGTLSAILVADGTENVKVKHADRDDFGRRRRRRRSAGKTRLPRRARTTEPLSSKANGPAVVAGRSDRRQGHGSGPREKPQSTAKKADDAPLAAAAVAMPPEIILPEPSSSRRRCARRFAMRWPRKCAATRASSSWARKSPNIRAPIRSRKDCCRNSAMPASSIHRLPSMVLPVLASVPPGAA